MAKKKRLNLKKIRPKKTPPLKRQTADKKVGRRHKLNYCSFVFELFRINALAAKKDKMTDGEIRRQILEEFGHLKEYKERFEDEGKSITVISRLRSDYNRGRLVVAEPPPKASEVSFSYDSDGDAVNVKFTNPRKMGLRSTNRSEISG